MFSLSPFIIYCTSSSVILRYLWIKNQWLVHPVHFYTWWYVKYVSPWCVKFKNVQMEASLVFLILKAKLCKSQTQAWGDWVTVYFSGARSCFFDGFFPTITLTYNTVVFQYLNTNSFVSQYLHRLRIFQCGRFVVKGYLRLQHLPSALSFLFAFAADSLW